MPWKVSKDGEKFCVHKMMDGEMGETIPGGCHATHAEAEAQMRALYASENKDLLDNVLTDTVNALTNALKDGNNLLANVTAIVEEHESRVKALTPGEEDTPQEQKEAVSEDEKMNTFVQRVVDAVKNLLPTKKDKGGDENVMIWKEGDTVRWMARYSNKFRDRDNPPEILSSAAHKAFVEKLDKGLAPLPELQIWHVEDWKIGQADWAVYDDSGFPVVGGHAIKGCEPIFEALIPHAKNIRVSHGMPESTIRRDENDKSVIVEYESREVSILPLAYPANELTGFAVLNVPKEEQTMSIPGDKRQKLMSEWGLTEAQLSAVEAMNATDAAKAAEAGIESKEKKDETPAADASAAATETPQVAATPDPAPAPAPAITIETVTQAVTAAMTEALKPYGERLAALDGDIKALKEAREKDAANTAAATPLASLTALFSSAAQSAIGAAETGVDGRTSLAKSKPEEAVTPSDGRTFVPFINDFLAGK